MLLLFVALPCEAKPLIKKYNLKKENGIYLNDKIKLIITGKGPFAACKLVERYGSKDDLFVNIGLCGHNDKKIGQMFLVGQVKMDELVDYPKIPWKSKIPVASLKTYLAPCDIYPKNTLVDMEGFGFFHSALSFACREEILLIKIISDNSFHPFEREKASNLIEQNIDFIDESLKKLKKKKSISIEKFLTKWHFTASEQTILIDLLHNLDEEKLFYEVEHLRSAKEVIKALNNTRMLVLE